MESSLTLSEATEILLGVGFSRTEAFSVLLNLNDPKKSKETEISLTNVGLGINQVDNLKNFSNGFFSSLVSSSKIPLSDILKPKYDVSSKDSMLNFIETRQSYSEDKLASNQGIGGSGGYSTYGSSHYTTYRRLSISKLFLSIFLTIITGIMIAFMIGAISRYGIYAAQFISRIWSHSNLFLISFSIFILIFHFLPLKSALGKILFGALLILDVFFIFGVFPALLIKWFFSSYENSILIAVLSLSIIASIVFFIINKDNFTYLFHKFLFFIGAILGACATVKLLL